jgi:hypothetical protein
MPDNTLPVEMEVDVVGVREEPLVEENPTKDDSRLPSHDPINIAEVLKIQELYANYSAGFMDVNYSNEIQIQRAKLLVVALLEHCKSIVHPSSSDLL